MTSETKNKFKYSRTFWTANTVELFERAAYYGVFIVLTLYLSRVIRFSDVEAALVAGLFSGGLYLLPTFSGAIADKIGFKKSLILAFSLLTIGYLSLAIFPSMLEGVGLVKYGDEAIANGIKSGTPTIYLGLGESWVRWTIIPVLILIMVGGSFIKAVITGTIAVETSDYSEKRKAKAYALFYMMVNIGAFSGKTIVKPLRNAMGDLGLVYLNYFSAAMTLLAVLVIIFLYKAKETDKKQKNLQEVWFSFIKIISNGKLVALTIIITGFWMVQHQLYATMPKYVLRLAGEGASPSWYANVNPLVVVLTVNLITSLMKNRSSLFSMTVGMFIMPVSALFMASGNLITGNFEFNIPGFDTISMHPVAMMMIIGIIFQALAEAFISPRYLTFFAKQAPKNEEGLYMGFSHLHSFISSILGFGLSGFLLEKYLPDPTLPEYVNNREAWLQDSANAHHIWFYFVAISLVAAIALIIYGKVTKEGNEEVEENVN